MFTGHYCMVNVTWGRYIQEIKDSIYIAKKNWVGNFILLMRSSSRDSKRICETLMEKTNLFDFVEISSGVVNINTLLVLNCGIKAIDLCDNWQLRVGKWQKRETQAEGHVWLLPALLSITKRGSGGGDPRLPHGIHRQYGIAECLIIVSPLLHFSVQYKQMANLKSDWFFFLCRTCKYFQKFHWTNT